MPIRVTKNLTGGQNYLSPFVGPTPLANTHAIPVLLSGLTAAEVDSNGVLKPGVPLQRSGALISAAAQVPWGVTVEALKVAASNSAGDLTAAGTVEVPVATFGQLNRAIMEDNLGRVLTANEIAGFALAGNFLKLVA